MATRSPPHDWASVRHDARNPRFSTLPSERNLMTMKLEAEVNVLAVYSSPWPLSVAMLTAVSSVRPPPRIWTVSKLRSVSNSENCGERRKSYEGVLTSKGRGFQIISHL